MDRFRRYFPDLVDIVRVEHPATLNGFGLTERERENRIKRFKECLATLPTDPKVPIEGLQEYREVAKEALQHYGALAGADTRWRPDDVPSRTISRLVSIVIGKPLSDVQRKSEFMVAGATEKPVKREVAVLAGVRLTMTWDYALVSIKVDPAQRRRASRFLGLVGSGNDPRSDVSIRHDDYLAEEAPHANS